MTAEKNVDSVPRTACKRREVDLAGVHTPMTLVEMTTGGEARLRAEAVNFLFKGPDNHPRHLPRGVRLTSVTRNTIKEFKKHMTHRTCMDLPLQNLHHSWLANVMLLPHKYECQPTQQR